MSKKTMALGLQGQIWLTAGERSIGGHGRMDLLSRIAELGSISQAAKSMKMSYKAAWDAVDHMNNLAGQPLVHRTTGGKGGGSTVLTERGMQLIENFKQLEDMHQRFLQQLSLHANRMADDLLVIRRLGMKTSARNQFFGTVKTVAKGAVNDEVQLEIPGGHLITATVTSASVKELGLTQGAEAFALIKASSIILVTEADDVKFSARNQLTGVVERIQTGAVNTEVVVNLSDSGSVAAIVTNESAKNLQLKKGSSVTALFKASSVIVGVPL